MVQHKFLSTRGYKISDDVLLVPLSWDNKDKVAHHTQSNQSITHCNAAGRPHSVGTESY